MLKKEWYHLYPHERIAPEDPLFWTRSCRTGTICVLIVTLPTCTKSLIFPPRLFPLIILKLLMACESCHGPGRDHVEIARSGSNWQGVADFALVDINSTNVHQIESCAKCHARRSMVHPSHHAGNKFLDHFLPEDYATMVSRNAGPYLSCRRAD